MIDPAELQAAGLYDPDAPDAADRLALLEYLVGLGATLEDFALFGTNELPAVGTLLALFPERRLSTVREVSEHSGVPVALVREIWVASGFPEPGDDDPIAFSADLDAFKVLEASFQMFGRDATMQLVRVVGSAAARVADTTVSMFNVNVAPGALEHDASLVELARANFESASLTPALLEAFSVLFRYHVHNARRFYEVSEGVEVLTRSVGFADLVGSTGLAAALEPRALLDALSTFEVTATEIIHSHGARLVKMIGDEVMFVCAGAGDAVDVALALVAAFERHNVLPPVRAGVATGEVISAGGDVSGMVVNLAARAVKVARPGSLLVDTATRDALDDRSRARRAGSYSLKGFPEPVPLYRVR